MVTVSESYALTWVDLAPVWTATSGLKPPRMAFSLAVTVGSPNEKPPAVRPKLSGSGKTGWGWSPKTRPENQRFVGGSRPSANRLVGNGLTVFLAISATSGSTWLVEKTSPVLCAGSRARRAGGGCGASRRPDHRREGDDQAGQDGSCGQVRALRAKII